MVGVLTLPFAAQKVPTSSSRKSTVGGEGGWDYLSVDQDARRLYVSHATKVVVIDIDKDAVVGEIADTPGVHGIAIAPKLGLGFTSNGRENKASIFDLKTLKTTEGGYRRESRRDPLRPGAAGGLHLQWAWQLGDGV